MAIGLKHSVPIVAYIREKLKRDAEHVVRQRKRDDPDASLSQLIGEALREKVEREREGATAPTLPHQDAAKIPT